MKLTLQEKSGALADPEVRKAAPRADQGLMVIIDRNMDRSGTSVT